MVRWLRFALLGSVTLALIAIGGALGLFLVANDRWEAVELHPWLAWLADGEPLEAWLPAIMAGWLLAVLFAGGSILAAVFYAWRRRQYESLVARLERELVTLRNLPFTDPAPFEDIPEAPHPGAVQALGRGDDDWTAGESSARLAPGPNASLAPGRDQAAAGKRP